MTIRMRFGPTVLFACVAGYAAAQDAVETASTNSPLVMENIVYTTLAPRGWGILRMSESQADFDSVAASSALDYDPEVSPDGRWLVFTSERRGNPDLWVLDLGTDSQPVLLTAGDSMQDAAAFSPDGKRLAFVDTRDGNAEIYVMPFRPDNPDAAFADAKNVSQSPGGIFGPCSRRMAARSLFPVIGNNHLKPWVSHRRDTKWRSPGQLAQISMSSMSMGRVRRG